MEKEDLKRKLLSIGIVEDNEYLDKYCDLISVNFFNKKKKFKTQSHHIIPTHYFKKNNLDVDNSSLNKVNLLHYQHFMAHYYLYKCSVNEYKYFNAIAVQFVLNNSKYKNNIDKLSDDEIIKVGDEYQEIQEYITHENSIRYTGVKHSEDRKYNSYQYIWINNGIKATRIPITDEIPEGYHRGRPPFSEEVCKNMSESKKGIPSPNKGKKLSEKQKQALREGWLSYWSIEENRIKDHNRKVGRPQSLESNEKRSKALKGGHISEEQKKQISQNNSGRKYVWKDGVQKFVKGCEVEEYLNNGWILGRISRIGWNKRGDNS